MAALPLLWMSKSAYAELIDLLNKLVADGVVSGATTITTALTTFTTEMNKY
jgi:hypothetical protein